MKAPRRVMVAVDLKLHSTLQPSSPRMHPHSKAETLVTIITFRSSNFTRETITKMSSSRSITTAAVISPRSPNSLTNREIARKTLTSSFLSRRSRSAQATITVEVHSSSNSHRPQRAKIQKSNNNSLLKTIVVQADSISRIAISRYRRRFLRNARAPSSSNRTKEAPTMRTTRSKARKAPPTFNRKMEILTIAELIIIIWDMK